MKNLSMAIYSKFTATSGEPAVHNSFYNAISGRLYKGAAPQNATEPYAVYLIVSDVPDWTFDKTYENVRIQFSIYTSDLSSNDAETIFGYLKTLYDWCSLSITNNSFVYMKRVLSMPMVDPDDSTWYYVSDYEIMMEKT